MYNTGWKCLYFEWDLTEGVLWQYVHISSRNVSAPNRQKAITSNNDEQTPLCHTVSLGQNELNHTSLVQIMAWHRPGAKPLSEPMMIQEAKLIYYVNHYIFLCAKGQQDIIFEYQNTLNSLRPSDAYMRQ